MECHKLKITIHSGKGLSDVKIFGTMNPYTVVWIAGDGKQSNLRQTKTVIKGGSSPVWDCRMEFNVASSMKNNYTLFCVIKHAGKLFDREIGHVQVPFRHLLAGDGSGKKVSYPVTNTLWEEQGQIIISHKFISVGSGEKDGAGGKVAGSPGKKKKKNGTKKQIAKKMANQVVAEVGSVAVAAGIIVAIDSMDDGSGPSAEVEEDQEGDADEDGEVDGYEDQDQDADEDGEVDGYELQDEEGDVDDDEDENEDEDEDDMEY